MVRKIISKKHKGSKDPLSLAKQKFKKIKDKIDNAPKDSDIQEMPNKHKSITFLKTSKRGSGKRKNQQQHGNEKFKKNNAKIKRKSNSNNEENLNQDLIDSADFIDHDFGWYPKNGRPFNPIPTVKQEKDEPSWMFLKRLKQASDAVIHESKFKDRFDVHVQRNEVGEATVIKKRKVKSEEQRLKIKERLLKLKMKKKKIKPQKQPDNEILTDDIDEREKRLFRKENIAFGEVVHRPPNLDTKELDKILKRQTLKGKNYFIQNLEKKSNAKSETEEGPISVARKQELAEEREAAISFYRSKKLN